MVEASSKLKSLRTLMAEQNVQAYIVPHSDPHMTEYVPVSDEWIAFISGFTGSNGLCVVTQNQALCWTDSRYFLQAEKQLEAGWEMRKMLKGEPTWFEWVASNLKSGETCGYDPLLVTIDTAEARGKYLKDKGIEFKPLKENLVGKIWTERPPVPQTKVYILDDSYAGESAKQKLQNIGKELKAAGAVNYLVTDLCEIAWTLNLRATDAECTPLIISYLWLSYDFGGDAINPSGTFFIQEDRLSEEVKTYLKGLNITVKPYDSVQETVANTETKTYVNRSGCNAALYQSFKNQDALIGKNRSIIEHLKGIKNAREIQGFRDCHVRDGAAVVRYFAWLDHALNVEGKNDITEYTGAKKLDSIRYEQKLNKGLSFPAISSIGSNGAIVHYKPEEKTAAVLNNKEVYLLDSGGQYLDGTTDITRTTHFGKPTDEEKDAFTRVLLGNLDVERVTFPNNGTYSGADIDVLARRHLWTKGLDFGHGTGHGVGYFLNVHEGPHGISKYRSEPILEGMVVTNEPGYYKAGGFGIRTENILVVVKKHDGKFLGFENVTLCPYERELLDHSQLTKADVDYINEYHERVYNALLPLLEEQGDKIAIEYLKKKTAKITL